MAPEHKVTVLEQCRVAPLPTTEADIEQSLPLTFFDIPWLSLPPVKHLLFYKFPTSKTYFTTTLIAKLKHSLSLTLKQFLPLAGNLIIPSNSSPAAKPFIRYLNGDSISVTFAEDCRGNFEYLTGNQARQTSEFYPLVPQLPQATNVDDTVVIPLLAAQFTLFPDVGMCVGFTMHHITGDASAWMNFIMSFASLTKFEKETEFLGDKSSTPLFDRGVIGDRNGLEGILWKQIGDIKYVETTYIHKVRTTFILTQADAEKLKKVVVELKPTLSYASTFTVACAYIWVCFSKLRAKRAKPSDEKVENFFWTAECRARLEPPAPATYFGNCLVPFFATAKTSELVREDGLVTAAEMIGEAIRKKLHSGEDVLKGFENWILDFGRIKANDEPVISVVGSPKFSFYGVDFGWGRPVKSEIISIDNFEGCFSFNDGKDSEGGCMEIGLSFPEIEMDAFATIFADGLETL
ncbi:hypothetical protein RJ640_024859 [Escallonia rubra]|uniref:Uncharacterized protein n=1 Tax=Escallonia rubra TaxID=112253 RepID=A0AA88QEP3_9ASTE|nr:hypothetical protein RJ640_024859 [Escallonia rubra]